MKHFKFWWLVFGIFAGAMFGVFLSIWGAAELFKLVRPYGPLANIAALSFVVAVAAASVITAITALAFSKK